MLDFNINNYLRLSASDVLIVCISTFLIVLAAKHFFWDKLSGFIQARQELIQNDLDSAAQEKAAALELKRQYEKQIADAHSEANAILDQAKDAAGMERKEILAKAAGEAALLKEKAAADIEREKVNARKEMKDAISDVAFEAAKRLVEKELDASGHRKYVDDFIEHAGDERWQA